MKVVFGASGFAKEIDWILDSVQTSALDSNSYFISLDRIGEFINGKEIISEEKFLKFLASKEMVDTFIGIGAPNIRKKVVESFLSYSNISFPNLIFPNVLFDNREGKVVFGKGIVICAGSILTTDIVIGDFVHVNLNCTIGHDSIIGSYSTLSPGVHISGNVKIGENVFIGTGAVVLEKIQICDHAIIGAGAVVSKSITEPGIYVGVPAKRK